MFTNDWFGTTGKGNFEKYVKPMQPKKSLEIGCYEGRASVWLLDNTRTDLTVVDTFKGSLEHDALFEATLFDRFSENILPYEDRVTVETGTSRIKLKEFKEEFFDFIYIDGSHQASDVLEDAVLAFPLLKPDGIIIFDDYTWGQGMDMFSIPSTGINAFLSVYGNQIQVLEKNSQVIIKKLGLLPV